jgi:hypothetical protein
MWLSAEYFSKLKTLTADMKNHQIPPELCIGKATRTLERVGRIGRAGRGGIFLRSDGVRTLERVGRVGIFLPIKHRAWYFRGGAAGIRLTAGC